ncbi:hypothetical protein C8R43DRAFT_1009266 [Mycena crocata]|nr:hypothetical protein C8R43DRAFT_1009266 [Mycena crocata]
MIPRPTGSLQPTKKGQKIADMQGLMGWSERDFHRFKNHVQDKSERLGLNLIAGPKEQDPQKWKELVDDCVFVFPALDDFENHWPVEVYFIKYSYWRYQHSKRRKPKNAPQNGAEASDHTQTRDEQTSRKRKERPDASDIENEPTRSNSNTASQKGSPSKITHPGRKVLGQNATDVGHSSSQTSNASSSSSTSYSTSTSRPARSASHTAHWRACIFCGFRPPIHAEETIELQVCFPGRDDLRQILATIGIATDRYLRAFLHLRARERDAFLDRLCPGRLSCFESIEISEMLEKYRKGAGVSEHRAKVPRTVIPRPRRELEDALSDHTCEHANVEKQMRVGDNEYFALVAFVEQKIPWYLDRSRSIEEQDKNQPEDLVDAVYEEHPALTRNYEDSWPVYVLIRRFLDARAAELSGTTTESQHDVAMKPHECPRQKVYPAADVPDSVASLFDGYGMDELGPAFLALGVDTDQRFSALVTSPHAKTRFLAKLSTLECSVFQLAMIEHIIKQL